MKPDWILNPLTQYILCAACLGGAFLLWISFKRELQMVRRNAQKSHDLLNATVQALSSEMDTIRETLRPVGPAASPQSSNPGFDLNIRTEVLRMSRRNEPVPAIAAAVRRPRNEIELLLKVDQLLNPEKVLPMETHPSKLPA